MRWLSYFFLIVILLGLSIIVIAVAPIFGLVITGSLVIVLYLVFYLWPIIGAWLSWYSLGLIYQPKKKLRYWGFAILSTIYGLGILCLTIHDLWPFGDWILLGNSLGILVRSGLYEWRVAQGRLRRLSINLLVAVILPLTGKAFVEYPLTKAQDCMMQVALDQTAEKLAQRQLQHGKYPPYLAFDLEFDANALDGQCQALLQKTDRSSLSIADYEYSTWLYQPTATGYRLGYWSRAIRLLESTLFYRVCWYDPSTQRSDCQFTTEEIVYQFKQK